MKKRILGLDTGTNSLGWAVVDHEENGEYTLVDKGVLIFQEGVKIEKGVESSKAAERRSHRALRRQYFRRRLRKIEVLKVLVKYNLCPSLSEEDLKLWKEKKIYPKKDEFMLWQRTNDNEGVNPYHCRYVCLTESLDLRKQDDRYTLGRAMYHLAQRRGFLSNRLDTTDEKEQGKVKEGIAGLSKEIQDAGCKYLGEYFYKLYSEYGNTKQIRSRYIDREEHYKTEFNAICEKQNLPEDMINELRKALYFQRPLKSQRQSVGKCTFEKNKARCSDSHPLFEEFRLLSFLNNVRVKGPRDVNGFRPLNEQDLAKIDSLFYRKSKSTFDFEDIAKKIAGKNNYKWKGDPIEGPQYEFNYRMSQSVPGCPTIAQLKDIFGEDWKSGIAETYDLNTKKDGTIKSVEEMVCDVWNVLSFFDSKEKLEEYGRVHLQLNDELAEKFAKIKLSHDYSSLSLKALRNILPFLRAGYLYSHAVFLANISKLVGNETWQKDQDKIVKYISDIIDNPEKDDRGRITPADSRIKEYLYREYGVQDQDLKHLYHPSMMETYPDAKPNKDGVVLLGSPRTNAVRNPMAMRSLHEVRKVINTLIKEGKINHETEVHIEYARELNDANMRAAINERQRELERKYRQYDEEIRKLYKEATGRDIEPTETDILKYQLWEEQNHLCLYTGKEIGIAEFLGDGPVYDIEHTIPRCAGGDSTQENLTLCDSNFNRMVKKGKIPYELGDIYQDIMTRLEHWRERIEDLTKQVDRQRGTKGLEKDDKDKKIRKRHKLSLELKYLKGKYERFMMREVPEGFARRQGAGIGLISKYAALYLKSYFKDPTNAERRQVYSVKGTVTSDFRKMWGLQDEYQKKSRDSHTHHCIDAIVIACIGKNEFARMNEFNRKEHEYLYEGRGEKPVFGKPWPTFTEDVKKISDELLVVHDTPDNMPKKASCKKDTRHGKKAAKGDCARVSLHQDTYYGAIEHQGEVRYVVRRPLSSFTSEKELANIVDDSVRETILHAVAGKDFKKAILEPIYMNEQKGILIKKVRCFANSVKNPLNIRQHRDQSTKEYKQQFHVTNEGNYCMAIYEGLVKGKTRRDFEIVTNIEAAEYFKKSSGIRMYPMVPEKSEKDLPLKNVVKIGSLVLLYENSKSEIYDAPPAELTRRLYKIVGLSSMFVAGCNYGVIKFRHVSEARPSTEVKSKNGAYKTGEVLRSAITMLHTQVNMLIEGYDFTISPLGEIILKH